MFPYSSNQKTVLNSCLEASRVSETEAIILVNTEYHLFLKKLTEVVLSCGAEKPIGSFFEPVVSTGEI